MTLQRKIDLVCLVALGLLTALAIHCHAMFGAGWNSACFIIVMLKILSPKS